MPAYSYEVSGTGWDQNDRSKETTWKVTGIVHSEKGDFALVPPKAQIAAFLQLTQGKAVYGHPGYGCNGPYTIERMLIEKAKI